MSVHHDSCCHIILPDSEEEDKQDGSQCNSINTEGVESPGTKHLHEEVDDKQGNAKGHCHTDKDETDLGAGDWICLSFGNIDSVHKSLDETSAEHGRDGKIEGEFGRRPSIDGKKKGGAYGDTGSGGSGNEGKALGKTDDEGILDGDFLDGMIFEDRVIRQFFFIYIICDGCGRLSVQMISFFDGKCTSPEKILDDKEGDSIDDQCDGYCQVVEKVLVHHVVEENTQNSGRYGGQENLEPCVPYLSFLGIAFFLAKGP